ncbi:MAG: YlbF family regulator [Oscillospiraceae bacterium]|nr:YlbF family regulator [Oscillospiraceae bacterium]
MTNIEQLTRELGAALQLAPQYVRFVAADDARQADEALTEQSHQLELVRMQYQNEAQKSGNDAKLEEYAAQFRQLQTILMTQPIMVEYQQAAEELDAMVHRTIAIIGGCANGENPATYEPRAKGSGCGGGGCGGGGCGGGCH